MPFTFSHPAIVIPLSKLSALRYSMTGLIAGSVAPDFEYFFRMNTTSTHSHNLWGVLYFNLPLGIILAYLYHGIVREPFIANTPVFISKHLSPFTSFDWRKYFRKHWVTVIISIIIGACSHLLWDGFTHGHGYFVSVFPTLKQIVIRTAHLGIPLFTILQHTSTLIGGAYIYYFIKKLPVQEGFHTKISYSYWVWVGIITVMVVALKFLLAVKHIFLGDVIIAIVAGSLIGILVLSILNSLKKQPI